MFVERTAYSIVVVLGLEFGRNGGLNPTGELQRLFLMLPRVCEELDHLNGLGKAMRRDSVDGHPSESGAAASLLLWVLQMTAMTKSSPQWNN